MTTLKPTLVTSDDIGTPEAPVVKTTLSRVISSLARHLNVSYLVRKKRLKKKIILAFFYIFDHIKVMTKKVHFSLEKFRLLLL